MVGDFISLYAYEKQTNKHKFCSPDSPVLKPIAAKITFEHSPWPAPYLPQLSGCHI